MAGQPLTTFKPPPPLPASLDEAMDVGKGANFFSRMLRTAPKIAISRHIISVFYQEQNSLTFGRSNPSKE